MEYKTIEMPINTLHIDLDNAFQHANTFGNKMAIFQVVTENWVTGLKFVQEVDCVKDIEKWLTNKENYLFKVKNLDDIKDVVYTLEDDTSSAVDFVDVDDEHAFYIGVGKLLEKLKNKDGGFIIDEYMEVIAETPLTKTMYNFNHKTFVIGTY